MRRTKAVITAVAVGVLTFATACASSASTPVSVPPDSFASTTESAATAETANDAIYLSTDNIGTHTSCSFVETNSCTRAYSYTDA